jgi:hypothetical protein
MEDVAAVAKVKGVTRDEAARILLEVRAKEIELEESDPLRFGFEPDIWKVCDALLGFEWCFDKGFLRRCRKKFYPADRTDLTDQGQTGTGAARLQGVSDGDVWLEFGRRMRKLLGFVKPVKMLLIMGGNRAGKTEYAAKRSMMMMAQKTNGRVFAMHMSDPRSVRDQQPLFWRYMPREWQVQQASVMTYIKYKRKTGFSENSFITPIGSEATFLNYMQDKDVALQGLEADWVWPDELVPADWLEDIAFRLASREGRAVPTFTPINGYTPSVKIFCDGATVARRSRAYLCPVDGGDWDEAGALGLSRAQYEEVWRAAECKPPRPALAPECVPEDCLGWLGEKDAGEGAWPAMPVQAGRRFEELPRVMRGVDERKGVVFFYPSDNPYGAPREVIAALRGKARGYVRERFYGQAERSISVMIPRWNRAVHVVKAGDVPRRGTIYMCMDPASDRNCFMSWFRGVGSDAFLYREWPGNYFIPGVGVPGPWAIPSGKRDGRNDGAPGEGAKPSFGFGNLRMKFELARLEGWEDWRRWRAGSAAGRDYPDEEELAEWDERNGADEVIEARFIDSRAASAPRVENDRPVTLQTLWDELCVFFYLTPGGDIADGVSKINSALDYEGDLVDGRWEFVQRPHFFVCEDCVNSIYALENWMNADGQHGACKDPMDLIRYFFMAGCEDVGGLGLACRGGVAYGGGGAGGRRDSKSQISNFRGRRGMGFRRGI